MEMSLPPRPTVYGEYAEKCTRRIHVRFACASSCQLVWMALFSFFEQGYPCRRYAPGSNMGQGDGRAAAGRGAALRGRVGGRVDTHDAARLPERRGREKVRIKRSRKSAAVSTAHL